MKHLLYTVQSWREGGMYASYCPELDLASCGRTNDEARHNLEEAVGIFVEECTRKGTLHELLEEAGYELNGKDEIVLRRREVTQDVAIAAVPAR